MIQKIKKIFLGMAVCLPLVLVSAPIAHAKVPDQGGITTQSAAGAPQSTASTQAPSSSSPNSSAQNDIQCGINEATGGDCSASSNPSGDLATTIKNILNILSAIAGVLAVIMIMVAGIRLVASAGNEEGVKKAKSSIVYAVIGIVIVAVAQIIVHFVITNIS